MLVFRQYFGTIQSEMAIKNTIQTVPRNPLTCTSNEYIKEIYQIQFILLVNSMYICK